MIDLSLRLEHPPILPGVVAEQLPFIEATAINQTVNDFQALQRRHMRKVFTVRNPRFVDFSVKRTVKASKRQPDVHAKVEILPPGAKGRERAGILAQHEEPGIKIPRRAPSLFVPTENLPRRAGGGVIAKWRPSRLKFRLHGEGERATVYRGRRKTFMLRYDDGSGIVFERDVDELVVLYHLIPRAPIAGDLEFIDNARRAVREHMAANFRDAWDYALRTARITSRTGTLRIA